MKSVFPFMLVALMLCPFQAWAQAHKCTMPDGSTQFQDAPCPSGAASADVQPLVVTPGPAHTESDTAPSRRGPNQVDLEAMRVQKQQQDEYNAKKAETDEYNKQVRCNNARQQLSVAKEQRPVYTLDNDGNRHYVADDDRAALTASAQQAVDEACN
jgi:hypothetical protein